MEKVISKVNVLHKLIKTLRNLKMWISLNLLLELKKGGGYRLNIKNSKLRMILILRYILKRMRIKKKLLRR